MSWADIERLITGLQVSGRQLLADNEALRQKTAALEAASVDHKRLEEELRRAQKLEAIGQLASGIAHDFNNMLMGVTGCLNIAVRQLDDKHPSRKYLEEARRALATGTAIISQLMLFSRTQEIDPDLAAIDLVIEKKAELLRRLIGESIELRFNLRAPTGRIRCPAGHIEQMLFNLVVNARDAMPAGGMIVIETQRRALTAAEARQHASLLPGSYVVMRVSDTGCGMDDNTKSHAFEPFFTTKDVGKGTGLGLSTVYGIVRKLGGQIEFDSTLGQGTTFTLYLPCLEGPMPPSLTARPVDGAAKLPPIGAGRTLLLVEDEPLVRQSVRDYVERMGFSVLDAADGDAALGLIRRHPEAIDLLITDMVLPGVQGMQLAKEVRVLKPGLPVIYMSAHPELLLLREGLLPQGAHSLQKPFSESMLRSAITAILPRVDGEPPGERAGRVLLVEDHDVILDCLCELLESSGYEVCVAIDGQTAEAAFRSRGPFDLVMTDLGLPDTPGDELVARLRSLAPSGRRDFAVLYSSGSRELKQNVHEALRQPRTAFLPKPMDLDQVMEKVTALLAER